ncbi:molybdenum cofactor biosynthesis protein MoaE [Planctomonas sp. JC2975]|uniref:molybdenum cofactor biosynthesis protein MoaE n=1 Tax=Planctomonas sp. JC2975 TaxID=2729626 RepID=UPI0014745ABE|nr:molybdenum cofactor biosynthesis protein MoaE [Planctomonas sp. JC2975]
MAVLRAEISADPLDLAAHVALVESPQMGAVATFVGIVRDHDPDAAGVVVALEYSAHPDAARVLADLAERVAVGERAEVRIAVSHRIGRLSVGDVAIVCAVASAHRGDAFDVCRELVEAVKHELPVWKKQLEADGSHSWVGLGGVSS